MSTLDNILSLLAKWDPWKRIQETPDRVDALERRVRELESKLRRAPGEACPSCGALEFRVAETKADPNFGVLGGRRHLMRCGECDFEDERMATE